MQTILVLLLAGRAMGSFNMAGCQALIHELKTDCMSHGCSGLLTTGVGSGLRVRDPKECEGECHALAKRSSERDEVCTPPLPPSDPRKTANSQAAPQNNQGNHSSEGNSQASSQISAMEKAAEGEDTIKAKEARAQEAAELGREIQQKKIASSKELIRRWEKELVSGKSQDFPSDRAKWKNDQALVREAERAREKKENFPSEKANQAELPAIRGNLNQFSRARQLEANSVKDLGLLAIALAQLAQMKSAGEANVAALGQTRASPAFLNSSPPTEAKKPLGAVSSAMRGNLRPGSAGEKEEKEKAEANSPGESPETLLANDSAAEGEGSGRSSLRARLREILRRKMAADGIEDMPKQFSGELGLSESTLGGGETFRDQALQSEAEEEIFRLAGADTDSEVQRLRNELQEELARSEGVLPSESLSLFERIKAAHQACAARNCVIPGGIFALAHHSGGHRIHTQTSKDSRALANLH